MSKSSLTPSFVSQKLSITPPAVHPTNLQPLVINPEDVSRGVLCCDVSSCSRWDRTWGWWAIHSILVPSALALYSQVYDIPKDPRQLIAPLYKQSSTQSDDIATISFHPTVSSPLILSGSSDCLLIISNPTEIDEGEAMLHVRSWGTSISHGTAQVPTHRHMGYGPLATWKHSVSGRTRFLILYQFIIVSDSPKLDQLLSSDIRSPSVHTQSRTWVTHYLIACLPLQEGLRLYVGSNEYALLPIH